MDPMDPKKAGKKGGKKPQGGTPSEEETKRRQPGPGEQGTQGDEGGGP